MKFGIVYPVNSQIWRNTWRVIVAKIDPPLRWSLSLPRMMGWRLSNLSTASLSSAARLLRQLATSVTKSENVKTKLFMVRKSLRWARAQVRASARSSWSCFRKPDSKAARSWWLGSDSAMKNLLAASVESFATKPRSPVRSLEWNWLRKLKFWNSCRAQKQLALRLKV